MTGAFCCLVGFSADAPRVFAQGNPPGTVTVTAAATGFHQFRTDLDQGGAAEWSTGALSAGVTRQFVPAFAAGVSLRTVFEDWRFDSPSAFGGNAPWQDLRRSSVGLNASLALSHTLVVGVSPGVEWAYEIGTSAADALTYGAVVSAVKVLSPSLTLGAGASVFRQFYSVKVSPFVIVNWKLSERLRIANALPAGPEGGAGIELRWALTPDWELAGGGVIRSDRYQLRDSGPFAGDIGEVGGTPLFARASRKLGSKFKADVYAGALTRGRLKVKDPDGHEIAADDYAVAPAVAATLSLRY